MGVEEEEEEKEEEAPRQGRTVYIRYKGSEETSLL